MRRADTHRPIIHAALAVLCVMLSATTSQAQEPAPTQSNTQTGIAYHANPTNDAYTDGRAIDQIGEQRPQRPDILDNP